MWIFGYGSLTWKVDFPYKQRVVGYIKGYSRRFWQASIDHRGVPGKERVWGIAYNIGQTDEDWVMAQLDHREKDGYARTPVTFHPQDLSIEPWQLIIYLGSETNPFFVGQNEEEENIAQIIALAEGPSGSNKEYLFQLADTMRTLGVNDSHLFNIESRVRKILEPHISSVL